eukprot:scaffold9442_cov117-Isochrysis_galbana.AAC.2
MHRPHRQQVLKALAVLAIVCDADEAVDAAAQLVLDRGDRGRLGFWPLQEAAVEACRILF